MSKLEEWRVVPGHPDYDLSSEGRVRSRVRSRPTIMVPNTTRSMTHYVLDGETHYLEDLMTKTYGVDGSSLSGRERDLPDYVVKEIATLEGIKPAYAVGEDFGIDSQRVRNIWDGWGS